MTTRARKTTTTGGSRARSTSQTGFNAGSVFEPLDWDFTAFDGGTGTTPEPTTRQIEDYLTGLRELIENIRNLANQAVSDDDADADDDEDEFTEDRVAEVMDSIDPNTSEGERQMDNMTELIAELCSHEPSVEQLEKLPHRVRTAFFGWITGQLLDPKALSPVTTALQGASSGEQSST